MGSFATTFSSIGLLGRLEGGDTDRMGSGFWLRLLIGGRLVDSTADSASAVPLLLRGQDIEHTAADITSSGSPTQMSYGETELNSASSCGIELPTTLENCMNHGEVTAAGERLLVNAAVPVAASVLQDLLKSTPAPSYLAA